MAHHVRSWAIAALAVFALAGAAAPSFAGIVYNVTNYAEGQNGWSVNGTITVSEAGTFTSSSAITAWDITLSKPDNASYQFTNQLSGITLTGFLTASTGTLDVSGNGLSLQSEGNVNMLFWDPFYTSYYGQINNSQVFGYFSFSPSNNGVWTIGTASASAVPEIDPATGGSALSLVAGVLAMIEQRRRRATLVA